jgi:ACS family glucarate transporter-like MFS transporter
MLTAFSILSYVLRVNITVAKVQMAPALGFSTAQTGLVLSAFMLGYALFQVPMGIWGDRQGPRFTLTMCGVIWIATTVLSGLVPGILVQGSTASFVSLLILRFVLGIGIAGTYPIAAKTVHNWFPSSGRAGAMAMVIIGAPIGIAFTSPFIATVMQAFGWRATFYLTALLPIPLVVWWWLQASDRPRELAGATTKALDSAAPVGSSRASRGSWLKAFQNRNLLILSLSYFLDSYVLSVFITWLFTYLVEERKLKIIVSGWLACLPYLLSTALLPSIGYLSDRLSARRGGLHGRRSIAIGCLLGSALMLLIGTLTAQVPVAVGAFSLSIALLFGAEGSYWSTTIDLGDEDAGASGGLMNLSGNLGALASTLVFPILVTSLHWNGALASGAACALVSAGLWLLLHVEPPRALSYARSPQ